MSQWKASLPRELPREGFNHVVYASGCSNRGQPRLEWSGQIREDQCALIWAVLLPGMAQWDGKGLPPIGANVLFDTASSGEVEGTVTGYHVEGSLDNDPYTHRVFVDLVYKGTHTKNSRLLKDVRPLKRSDE